MSSLYRILHLSVCWMLEFELFFLGCLVTQSASASASASGATKVTEFTLDALAGCVD